MTDVRLADGVTAVDLVDSLAVVAGHVLVRLPGRDALREAIARLRAPTPIVELQALLPGIDVVDLVERLRVAGVLVDLERARTDVAGAAPAFDARIPGGRSLRLAVAGDEGGVEGALAASAPGLDVDVVDVEAADAVVVASTSPAALAADCATLWREGRVHVPLDAFDGDVVVLGPVVLPGLTACFDCLTLRRGGATSWPDRHWEVMRDASSRRPWRHGDLEVAVRLAARLLVSALVDGDEQTLGHATTWSPAAMTMRTTRIWRIPRCPTCSELDAFTTSYPWSTPSPAVLD